MTVDEAIAILKKNGYKQTDKREDILRLFRNDKRYISAKEVLNKLKEQYPGLSFDTIYRNLSLFAELGILEVTELEGEKKFRFTCSVDHHHHHFICLTCGKTKQIDHCPMEIISDELDEFEIIGHKFEVYGTCKECKKK
ncbi:Fur family transcriptional regulator [Massilibacterium senegalense]|uniref:Fur family transcriptional regulator n=1 Tax=Massilibacterium senegalense TaxID=1632858 RepID=UPI000781CADD|nr:Fur family transcriptional regulator [Massilibacterium senegalense]